MMSVTVTCAECGTAIVKRYPCLATGRRFCNRKCLGKYRSRVYVGESAPRWRGGTARERNRVRIHRPDHPHAQANGYVYRYRLVAEEKLGRFLRPDEIVHHIDGDESNDHPDNLLVTTQAEHASRYDAHRPVLGVIPDQCSKGHPLNQDNLYTYQRDHLTKWSCRICTREAGRRHDARRRGRNRSHATL